VQTQPEEQSDPDSEQRDQRPAAPAHPSAVRR
jgi:hypothetical protein